MTTDRRDGLHRNYFRILYLFCIINTDRNIIYCIKIVGIEMQKALTNVGRFLPAQKVQFEYDDAGAFARPIRMIR